MFKYIFITICCLLNFFSAIAKDTCKIGIYIQSIHDINLREKSFKSSFWLWKVYDKKADSSLKLQPELLNTKSFNCQLTVPDETADKKWMMYQYKAEHKASWQISNYPFDKQILYIEIEDGKFDTSKMHFIADTLQSKLDEKLSFGDFIIEKTEVAMMPNKYNTNYGNPASDKPSVYSKFVFKIYLKRKNSFNIFALQLTGLFVSFFIGLFCLFVSPKHSGPRMGLCVGSLFSAVGSKTITENLVPPSSNWTLYGNLHNITFMAILLIVIASIHSIYMFEKGKLERALSNDKKSFYAILCSYVLGFVLLVWGSIT